MSDGSREQCGHGREDATPCQSPIGLCDRCGKCWTHCQHVSDEERTAARSRGGYAAAREDGTLPPGEVPPAPQTLTDAVRWSAWAARAAVIGELNTARANSAAKLLKEFRQALERTEAKAELEELREALEELRGEEPELEAVP